MDCEHMDAQMALIVNTFNNELDEKTYIHMFFL